jgi:hypothetical protein
MSRQRQLIKIIHLSIVTNVTKLLLSINRALKDTAKLIGSPRDNFEQLF